MKCHQGVQILVLLSSFSLVARTEFFTSISELQTLLRTEGELAKTLDKYVEAEEKRLDQVRRLSKGYKKMYNSAVDNEIFLLNPANAYLLVKHLTADWRTAGQLIDETSQIRDVFDNITRQDLKFPDDEDLSGAATALIRLQETYLLNTTELASGEIDGTARSLQFSAGDCAEIGYQALKDGDYVYSILWMQEALNRLQAEEQPTASRISVLEHMAYANYMLGQVNEAIAYTQEIIREDPSYLAAHENLAFYRDHLSDSTEGQEKDNIGEKTYTNRMMYQRQYEDDFVNYEKLCRGEKVRTPLEESQLHCRYTNRNNPYLILQPVKEEDLSTDPSIVMFHDIISDKDAETLKQLSLPKLKRAQIVNPETGNIETAIYRVSKSSWLDDEDHPLVARISRYIQDITGLATHTAELLHVINYGIGGHYEPHHDFSKTKESKAHSYDGTESGDRIATWIYYLSDVEAGGSTVFPLAGVQVKPVKGSAAFWYNLRRNGDGDMNTKHAACPVLSGSKWVANKWIHELNNEFRRKCSLDRSE